MKVVIIGASGTVGQAVVKELSPRHEIVKVGRKSGDVNVDITSKSLTLQWSLAKIRCALISNIWIFFNDKVSVVGEDQAVLKRIGDRYQLTSAIVRPIYFDVANGY